MNVYDIPAFTCPICGGSFVDLTGLRTRHHYEVHVAMGEAPELTEPLEPDPP